MSENKSYHHALLAALTGACLCCAQSAGTPFDTIAGPLPKNVKAAGTPYVVAADIEVPANKTVTIEPGVVFLFKNFTGLHVEGKLVAEGTKLRPIVFTSENDAKHNPSAALLPNLYDWNGIYIHEGAFGTLMSHCQISYTVYGIVSETKFIRISASTFRDNGKSDLVIEGEEFTVGSEPYSYVLSVKDATVDGVQVNLLKDPVAPRRNIFRYTGLAVALAGYGLGTFGATKLKESQQEYEELSSTEQDNLLNNTCSDWWDARKKRNNDILLTSGYFGAALLGTVCFIWTFSF